MPTAQPGRRSKRRLPLTAAEADLVWSVFITAAPINPSQKCSQHAETARCGWCLRTVLWQRPVETASRSPSQHRDRCTSLAALCARRTARSCSQRSIKKRRARTTSFCMRPRHPSRTGLFERASRRWGKSGMKTVRAHPLCVCVCVCVFPAAQRDSPSS